MTSFCEIKTSDWFCGFFINSRSLLSNSLIFPNFTANSHYKIAQTVHLCSVLFRFALSSWIMMQGSFLANTQSLFTKLKGGRKIGQWRTWDNVMNSLSTLFDSQPSYLVNKLCAVARQGFVYCCGGHHVLYFIRYAVRHKKSSSTMKLSNSRSRLLWKWKKFQIFCV